MPPRGVFQRRRVPRPPRLLRLQVQGPLQGPRHFLRGQRQLQGGYLLYIIYIIYIIICYSTQFLINEGCEPRVRVLVSRRLPGQPRYSVCSLETETELLLLNNPVIRKYVIIDFIRTFR